MPLDTELFPESGHFDDVDFTFLSVVYWKLISDSSPLLFPLLHHLSIWNPTFSLRRPHYGNSNNVRQVKLGRWMLNQRNWDCSSCIHGAFSYNVFEEHIHHDELRTQLSRFWDFWVSSQVFCKRRRNNSIHGSAWSRHRNHKLCNPYNAYKQDEHFACDCLSLAIWKAAIQMAKLVCFQHIDHKHASDELCHNVPAS